jgi:hypothetical protein
MVVQQRHPGRFRRPRRQRHHHLARPRVDPQTHAPRPRAPAPAYRGLTSAQRQRRLFKGSHTHPMPQHPESLQPRAEPG